MTRILILIILFSLFLPGCLTTDTKCCDYVNTYTISKGLYEERYRTFCAGVFGQLTDCYLTDSTTFRQMIGSYDEHEYFHAELDGDKIRTYNLTTSAIPDTLGKRTFSEKELQEYHHSDKNCLTLSPIFGKNTLKCDNDFYPAWTNKTGNGYYLPEVQYKCGSDYQNAVFLTDSLHFSVLLGIRSLQSNWGNIFSIATNANGGFDLYYIAFKQKIDTVQTSFYLLPDLQKGKFIKVCQ